MRAFIVDAPGSYRVADIDPPRIRDDEVLVRVKAATICHSDLQILRGQRTHRLSLPLVPGHEFAGVVEEVGARVDWLKTGAQVACEAMAWCGRCPACRRGQTSLCHNYSELGCTRPGGFQQLVAVPARGAHVAQGLSFESLAMAEPSANALSAVEAAAIEPGDSVAVIGIGPIGILAVEIARLRAPAELIAIGTRPERLAVAAALGATVCIDARASDARAEVMKLTRGKGVRKIIQCGPTREAFELAVAIASFDATVAIEAAPDAEGQMLVPIADFVARHFSMVGVTGYSTSSYARVLAMMRAETIHPSRVITHRLPLERIGEGLEILEARREGVLKVCIIP